MFHTRRRAIAQHLHGTELDGIGGTRLGARRFETGADAIVAQRALLRCARHVIDVDHAERARADAVATAVARVRLNDDGVELGSDDRAGGAHFQAGRLYAVLAHVAHHEPAPLVRLWELLDELDVPPRIAAQAQCVVVALPAHLEVRAAVAARGELVPLLARHLARLAPDAHRGVGEEAHRLVRRAGRRRGRLLLHDRKREGHQAFSTLQTNAFPSWMETFGSPDQLVRSLTTSPTARPCQPQCQGMPTW